MANETGYEKPWRVILLAGRDTSRRFKQWLEQQDFEVDLLVLGKDIDLVSKLNQDPRLPVVIAAELSPADIKQVVATLTNADLAFGGFRLPASVITDNPDDDSVVQLVKAGAYGLIPMNAHNLAPAMLKFQHEWREWLQQVQEKLEDSLHERRVLVDLISHCSDGILHLKSGRILLSNSAFYSAMNVSSAAELKNKSLIEILPETNYAVFLQAMEDLRSSHNRTITLDIDFPDGSKRSSRLSLFSKKNHEPTYQLLIPMGSIPSLPSSPLPTVSPGTADAGYHKFLHIINALEQVHRQRLAKKPEATEMIAVILISRFDEMMEESGLKCLLAFTSQVGELIRETLESEDYVTLWSNGRVIVWICRNNSAEIEDLAGKWHQMILEHVFEADDVSQMIQCNIGLRKIFDEPTGMDVIVAQASQAATAASKAGDSYKAWTMLSADTSGRSENNENDRRWAYRIREALHHQTIRPKFLPIARLNAVSEGYYSIRIRMQEHNSGKEFLPAEFLPAAEKHSLMPDIDRWVIKNTRSWIKSHQNEIEKHLTLFILLSNQSLKDDRFIAWLVENAEAMADWNQNTVTVVLEIPEPVMLQRLKQMVNMSEVIRKAGFGLALKNFGQSGHPMQTLRRLPFTHVKLDRSLVQGISKSQEKQDALLKLLEETQSLGIHTIAEQPEDTETMMTLWNLGLEYVEGDYIQEPDVILQGDSSY